MIIKKIELQNYRNIEKLYLELNEKINIFIGKNAQGKTNFLESIFVGSVSKSFRFSKDTDLIQWGKNDNYIKIDLEKSNVKKKIEIIINKNTGSSIKINNITLEKKSEIIGVLNVVVFSPESINLINGTPSDRRKYLNVSISKIKPKYKYLLTKYKKIVYQRNNILKEMQNNNKYIDLLSIWNKYLVETGIEIMKYRFDFLEKINKVSCKIHNEISGGTEKMEINYKSNIGKIKEFDEIKLINIFNNKLNRNIEKEIERKITLFGPHLDDIDINIDEKESKIFSSQGQKRTASLSLVLSEIEVIKNETGDNPVLLLDDVFSELDRERKTYLLKYINNIQTIITSTDNDYINSQLDKMKKNIYFMENGNIKKIEVH